MGIDPQAEIDVAKEIISSPQKYMPVLQWRAIPTYKQIYAICDLIWDPFKCSRLGAGSARSAKQLGLKLIQLHSAPTTKELIATTIKFAKDPDESVAQVLDFLRLWANFHFPQLLRCLDRIQKDVFKRLGVPSGDYDLYAAKIESRFIDPSLVALEEYGIPLEIALKLRRYLQPFSSLDEVLKKLRSVTLAKTNLSDFERAIVKDAQQTL